MKTRLLTLLILLMPAVVSAASSPGQATDDLLAMQSSGLQASDNPQALSGAYREKASARFLKTLDQDVPPVKFDTKLSGKD